MKLNKEIHDLFREAQSVAGIHNVEVAGYLVLAQCILELKMIMEKQRGQNAASKKVLVQGEE